MYKNVPWVDKYRPKKLYDIIYQTEVTNNLKNIVSSGKMPHLILYGPSGTGKTSAILALATELFGPKKVKERVMELNASDERGINVVRHKIINFVKSVIGNSDKNYLCPDYKIIILDEADAMTIEAQSALRKMIETYSNITRFCFICNYVNQLIEPIISRCVKYKFAPLDNKSIISRLNYISIQEKIDINHYFINRIASISNGDMRRSIMMLQHLKYILSSNNNKQCTLNNRYSTENISNKIILNGCIFDENISNKNKIDVLKQENNTEENNTEENNTEENNTEENNTEENIPHRTKLDILNMENNIEENISNENQVDILKMENIIKEISTMIPESNIKKIIDICLFDENVSINNIIKIVENIQYEGYAAFMLIKQIGENILHNDILTDKQKGLICIQISQIDKMLINGANEYIQLLQLLLYIKCVRLSLINDVTIYQYL